MFEIKLKMAQINIIQNLLFLSKIFILMFD